MSLRKDGINSVQSSHRHNPVLTDQREPFHTYYTYYFNINRMHQNCTACTQYSLHHMSTPNILCIVQNSYKNARTQSSTR